MIHNKQVSSLIIHHNFRLYIHIYRLHTERILPSTYSTAEEGKTKIYEIYKFCDRIDVEVWREKRRLSIFFGPTPYYHNQPQIPCLNPMATYGATSVVTP